MIEQRIDPLDKVGGDGDKVALVTDSGKAQELGISEFPALVVAGKVISAGKILKSEEIQKLLSKLPGKKS